MKKTILLFSICAVIISITSLPFKIHAQSREGEDPWGGRGQEEIREWRRRESSLSRKINNLDDDKELNMPVPILFGVTPDNISPNFGDPRSGGRTHEGLDIMAPKGAPIVTPTDAVVLRVGEGENSGNYVYTANPGGETFAYMHLDEMSELDEGDEIDKGELIGYVGNTGNASGGPAHLHFEIRTDRTAIDPYSRLDRIFPLADKIKYLEEILDNANDEEGLAEEIVSLYLREITLATSLNIALPESVTKAIASKIASPSLSATRILRLGSRGDDVRLLQAALGISADGVFGPQTKTALIAFQTKNGLAADGIFGPASRERLAALLPASISRPAGCTETTIYSPTTGVKC